MRDLNGHTRQPRQVLVLSFSLMMLNTDLHNSSIAPAKKMRREQVGRME